MGVVARLDGAARRDASPCLTRRQSGGSPIVKAEEVFVGVTGDAMHLEEFKRLVIVAPGTQVEDARAEVLRDIREIVLGQSVIGFSRRSGEFDPFPWGL